MRLIYSLLSLPVLLLAFGCKKDMPAKNLPPVTREGKNTAGFLLEGEVWVPFVKCSIFQDPCREISASYGPPNNSDSNFSFQLFRVRDDHKSYITITGQTPIYATGDYSKQVNVSFTSEEWSGNAGHYSYSGGNSRSQGQFIFTRLDSLNEVMSGTFNFILRESNGSGNTIEITEGRFDFMMDACICK